MGDAFSLAVAFVLTAEGHESNDPEDPGGLTHFGISQANHPDIDVAHLTERAAVDLYRARYWDRYRLERLPPAVGIAALDATVQHGKVGVRILQSTVGVVVDGVIGPITLAAVYRMGQRGCLTQYLSRRAVYYAALGNWPTFGRGWMVRLFNLQDYCMEFCNEGRHATV